MAQDWLTAEKRGRLAIVTRNAVAVSARRSPPTRRQQPLWGLLRSAQAEHPGRFLLIDSDGSEASEEALGELLDTKTEPQLALREGCALAPRATGVETSDGEEGTFTIDPERTVLLTGATGGLGSLVARHLVEAHGARHLLLASRSGEGAEGATDLRAMLQELGAKVRIAACDVADREQLEQLIGSIPASSTRLVP